MQAQQRQQPSLAFDNCLRFDDMGNCTYWATGVTPGYQSAEGAALAARGTASPKNVRFQTEDSIRSFDKAEPPCMISGKCFTQSPATGTAIAGAGMTNETRKYFLYGLSAVACTGLAWWAWRRWRASKSNEARA